MKMNSEIREEGIDQDYLEIDPRSPQPDLREKLARLRIFIASGSKISCQKLRIGKATRINGPIIVKGISPCSIGKYCAFGDGIHIITSNHDVERANLQDALQVRHGFRNILVSKGEVTIGNNVWIGDSALILSGVTVGDGAVIGAGSVVTKGLPPFSIAAGVPAKVIRMRFSQAIICQLLEIRWWDWSEEKISRNRRFFELNLNQDSNLNLREFIAD